MYYSTTFTLQIASANGLKTVFLGTVLGCVHTSNTAVEIMQLKEECRTIGHELQLSKDGFSKSSSIVCICDVERTSCSSYTSQPKNVQWVRLHKRWQDPQKRILLLMLVSLFVNEVTVTRCMCRRTIGKFVCLSMSNSP